MRQLEADLGEGDEFELIIPLPKHGSSDIGPKKRLLEILSAMLMIVAFTKGIFSSP
jgi:hypothetical protein